MSEYRICKRCVMDTTDPDISFNEFGVCNHCRKFDSVILPLWQTMDEQTNIKIIEDIKKKNCNKEYDAIIGLSGGVDSSYLLHYAIKKLKMRLKVVHIDAGWNSEVASSNIEILANKLGVQVHTIKIDFEEMRDLQIAFLKSGVANCDTPQDHAFFGALYQQSEKSKIQHILTGGNFATESVLPVAWGHVAMDSMQLLDIHKRFGKMPLKSFPVVGFWKYYFYYPIFKQMKSLQLLNGISYSKKMALKTLKEEYGWQDYGAKHTESIWTKFFQEYFLPTKFGYDKRKAHYSSLILSGELTREEALFRLKEPSYNIDEINEILESILGKLKLTKKEWGDIVNTPIKSYKDYSNNEALYQFKKKWLNWI